MHHTFFTDLGWVGLEAFPGCIFAFIAIYYAREYVLAHDGSGRLSFAQGWIGGLLCAPLIPLGIFGYWTVIDYLAQSETVVRLLTQI